jgi:hypothetical protein
MGKKQNEVAIPDEVVMNKIYVIRSQKVMLDKDLAELYNVETKQLKRAQGRPETHRLARCCFSCPLRDRKKQG